MYLVLAVVMLVKIIAGTVIGGKTQQKLEPPSTPFILYDDEGVKVDNIAKYPNSDFVGYPFTTIQIIQQAHMMKFSSIPVVNLAVKATFT